MRSNFCKLFKMGVCTYVFVNANVSMCPWISLLLSRSLLFYFCTAFLCVCVCVQIGKLICFSPIFYHSLNCFLFTTFFYSMLFLIKFQSFRLICINKWFDCVDKKWSKKYCALNVFFCFSFQQQKKCTQNRTLIDRMTLLSFQ